jgi:hypothetical protein
MVHSGSYSVGVRLPFVYSVVPFAGNKFWEPGNGGGHFKRAGWTLSFIKDKK